MHHAVTPLETLTRPRLLVVSARHALRDYCRATCLPRLLGMPVAQCLPAPRTALARLLVRERALERARQSHDASWSAAMHVAVITALLHESLLFNAAPALPVGPDAPPSA